MTIYVRDWRDRRVLDRVRDSLELFNCWTVELHEFISKLLQNSILLSLVSRVIQLFKQTLSLKITSKWSLSLIDQSRPTNVIWKTAAKPSKWCDDSPTSFRWPKPNDQTNPPTTTTSETINDAQIADKSFPKRIQIWNMCAKMEHMFYTKTTTTAIASKILLSWSQKRRTMNISQVGHSARFSRRGRETKRSVCVGLYYGFIVLGSFFLLLLFDFDIE